MALPRVLFSRRNEKGQALLIAVLIMVVALTVGLSVAARSIVNLRITTEQANSQKAFSAAEAGIEQALQNPTNVGSLAGRQLNGATIQQVTVSQVMQNNLAVVMNNGVIIPQDQGVDVWLTKFSEDRAQLYKSPWTGTLTVYWGTSGDCTSINQAALEVIVFTGNRTTPMLNRYLYDPCQARAVQNNFTFVSPASPVPVLGDKKFYYKAILPLITNGLIARITPIYTSTFLGVSSNSVLPPQGQIISATAYATGNALNATYRKLIYYQSFDSVPSELFYSILVPK